MNPARRMWSLFEPIHGVLYFTDEAAAAAEAAGYRGFWMGYFAFRMAPMGPVDAPVAGAACFGFDRSRVARALPDAWSFAPPDVALRARQEGATAALRRICAEVSPEAIAEAAELAWRAAAAADTSGRVLAAANAALARPDDPWDALWQATTTLREHRGDGHNAVLVAAGIGPVEAHAIKLAADESEPDRLRMSRNWPDAAWGRAQEALRRRGWLDEAGALTPQGTDAHQRIEDRTDAIAAVPWDALGPEDTARAAELLLPLARAVVAVGAFPVPSPVGLAAKPT